MQFDPGLDQLELLGRKTSSKHSTIFNRDGCLEILLADMEMRKVVTVIIFVHQGNDDAVEHADGGHVGSKL